MSRRSRSFLLPAGIGAGRFSKAGAGPASPAADVRGPDAESEVPTARPSAGAVTSGSEPAARPAALPGASSFACARFARQTVSESS